VCHLPTILPVAGFRVHVQSYSVAVIRRLEIVPSTQNPSEPGVTLQTNVPSGGWYGNVTTAGCTRASRTLVSAPM
jgi:hypothetical protein